MKDALNVTKFIKSKTTAKLKETINLRKIHKK